MYAVIKTGGKQYRVMQGETLRVEKLPGDVGAAIKFEEVLLLGAGEDITLGAPLVAGAVVAATIKSHGLADKIRIIKFRRRAPSEADGPPPVLHRDRNRRDQRCRRQESGKGEGVISHGTQEGRRQYP